MRVIVGAYLTRWRGMYCRVATRTSRSTAVCVQAAESCTVRAVVLIDTIVVPGGIPAPEIATPKAKPSVSVSALITSRPAYIDNCGG